MNRTGWRAAVVLVLAAPLSMPQAQAQAVPPAQDAPIIVPITPPTTGAAKAGGATKAPIAIRKITVQMAPLTNAGLDIAKAAQSVQVLDESTLTRNGAPNVIAALQQRAAGVNLASASGNPNQPTLFYHGFEVSALEGTSQGLAVYVDGVRFNEPFGDTVNWDLLPQNAIRSLTVQDSNPVFGLNALGGAIDIRLKNGFDYHGGEVRVLGGSFGRAEIDGQYGVQAGNTAAYFAASERHEAGWRQDQSSDIQNFYGDLAWRGPSVVADASVTLAHSALNGPGTTPVQLLAVDPSAQYTAPNFVGNRYAAFAFRLSDQLDADNALQAIAYYDYFLQKVSNGNAPNDLPCANDPAYLCSAPGVFSTTRGGALIPAFAPGNFYSELDQESTNTNGFGGSLQWTNTADLAGRGNHFIAGASFDGSNTEFGANGLIGGIGVYSRAFIGPGIVIDEPGTNVPVQAAFHSAYFGVYASDTFDVTKRLSITASARINADTLTSSDQGGNAGLSGQHFYSHLNPALGFAYRLTPLLTLYGGYAGSNRNPTPAELSCAGPDNACSLANFFVNDPNLKQVVGRTWEAGLRGAAPIGNGTLTYTADYFHTVLNDDIQFVNATTLGRAYFTNVGNVLRQGMDLGLDYQGGPWHAYFDYSFIDATFQSGFVEAAGANPAADANGNITIVPGDHLPGIPQNQFKFGADYSVTPKWSVGISAVAVTSNYLFGDQANLNAPLPGYVVANLTTKYQVTKRLQLFGTVENITDATYYTYGGFASLGDVYVAQAPNMTNPRAYSPGAPIGGYVGLKMKF